MQVWIWKYFPMVVWSLWYQRNQVRIGNSVLPLGQTLTWVLQQLQDFYWAQTVKPAPSQPTYLSTTRWTPPSTPTLKVNYDGAVFRETNAAGIGAVIWDCEGRVLPSLVERIPLPQIVADMEAAVARRAILLAKDLNLSSITLEGNSEVIT